MYESRQMQMKERADNLRHDVIGENRGGFSAVMKTKYEGGGGLSFEDVRIHYHIQKTGSSQASADTRENRAYFIRRQERDLQQPVIQGVFLRWKNEEDGRQYLEEVTDGGHHDLNTAEISDVGVLFELLKDIIDTDLIGRLSGEIGGKLHQVTKEKDVLYILSLLHSSEAGERIVGALDRGCCNWLWSVAERVCSRLGENPSADARNAVSAAGRVKALVERRFFVSEADRTGTQKEMLGAAVTDSQRYGEVMWKIDQLRQMIDMASGIQEPKKKQRLKQLIYYDILGYMRLRARFRKDFKMRQMPLEALQTHYKQMFQEQNAFAEAAAATASVEPAVEPNGLPIMYAGEKSRQVPLPDRAGLPAVINNDEPIVREDSKVGGDVAKQILEKVTRATSREQLVIYRSMDSGEALSILKVFNTSAASELEQAVMNHNDAHPFDVHNIDKRANLGKHYGEYAQAAGYNSVRDGIANVLLAFILKPGATQLLFSKSMLALSGSLRQNYEHFASASENEGIAAGYIGVKDESPQGVNSYSLGVSQPKSDGKRTASQLLLQLLIDRVEVRKIECAVSGS